jgi:hypothetical protein
VLGLFPIGADALARVSTRKGIYKLTALMKGCQEPVNEKVTKK